MTKRVRNLIAYIRRRYQSFVERWPWMTKSRHDKAVDRMNAMVKRYREEKEKSFDDAAKITGKFADMSVRIRRDDPADVFAITVYVSSRMIFGMRSGDMRDFAMMAEHLGRQASYEIIAEFKTMNFLKRDRDVDERMGLRVPPWCAVGPDPRESTPA